MNHSNRITFSLLFCVAAIAAGCQQNPEPAKVANDIAHAQADGQKKIADARANLQKVMADNRTDTGQTESNASPPADAANPATPTSLPNDTNQTAAASAKIADAQYDLDKAIADAEYGVALANCGSSTGDAEKSCKEAAKSKNDADTTAMKSKRDAAKKQ